MCFLVLLHVECLVHGFCYMHVGIYLRLSHGIHVFGALLSRLLDCSLLFLASATTKELERQLAAKQASLPEEPALNDENAITLLVRMPDGSRHGRRFRKSDKLQALFNFIDVGRMLKPGTYRLVRPYPRRAFSDGENSLSLSELGLTSKQEALFLELI